MSKITKYSDHVTTPKNTKKNDIDVLLSVDNANNDLQNMEQKSVELQNEIDKESARMYPNTDHIARCQIKLNELKTSILICKRQRIK